MSEHHRGAWGTREDPVWWPATISAADQQTLHHQHLLNQHHQQQLAAQQQVQQIQQHQIVVQQQQQQQQQAQQQQQQQQQQQAQQQQQQQQHNNDVARSNCTTSTVATQQLFSYKMASSFQNPATTMAINVSSSNTPVTAYDYRLNMANLVSRPGDPPGMSTPTSAGTQWWYTQQNQNSIENAQHQQNIQQQQNLSNQHNIHNVHTPPPTNQHMQNSQAQQNNQQIHVQNQNSKMPRVKADAKPRGRMTAYAFFVQTCREEHKKKHPEETVIFAEFSKKCAERWKTMLDKEKKRFHEMAEKDKKRYDSEMQNYVPPKGVVIGRGKKRKQIKDPNAPKRSLSAFFWFCNDERTKVKALNPEYGVGDIAKELGRKWSDADPSMKQKYEALAEEDKRRYEREMTEYKKKGKIIVSMPQPPPQIIHQPEDDEEDDDADDDENE